MRPPKKLRALARHLPLEHGPWLELACGGGQHLVHLAPGSLGVDRDAGALERCRARGLRAEQRDLDVEGWSMGLEPPHAVLAVDLLMHLRRPANCLEELARFLPVGTPLALCEWVFPAGGLPLALALAVPGARRVRSEPEHLRHYTAHELEQLLEAAGFALERVEAHSLPRALRPLAGAWWPPRTWIARAAP